jgi:hypothetical protein
MSTSRQNAERVIEDGSVYRPSQFPSIPLLEQTEVLIERDGGLTECYVPTELIDHEEVPVKEEWAASIASNMQRRAAIKGGSGQKTPIQLGWIEGETKFKIIDGFHRDAALLINNEDKIFSTVEHTDWNSLYDSRIFTAKDHTHVRFSRVVRWIQEVWKYSGLDDKLSVEQAILLYRYEGTGSKLKLTPEEVDTAKKWVETKEKQWDMQAMTIHSHLQTAERVDPMLVNATREKKNSRALDAPTQIIIKTFSEFLPNNFELQNLVWLTAKAHNLKSPEVKALCNKVRVKNVEEAQELLNTIDIKNIEPAYAETQGRQLRRAADPRYKGAAALNAAKVEIQRVNQRVLISLEKDEEVEPGMQANLNETVRLAVELQNELGTLATNIVKLKEKAAANAAPVVSKQSVERAFARHKTETEKNTLREPEPRLRTSLIVMKLPNFGKFTMEDWSSLEVHHRIALALDHEDIQNTGFESDNQFWKKIAEMSLVNSTEINSAAATIKAAVTLLTVNSPAEVGNVIVRDKTTKKITLTEYGKEYLKDVVKNNLLEIDDSKTI